MQPQLKGKTRERINNYRIVDESNIEDFEDQRDSFGTIYLSLIPFLALEYFMESYVSAYPAALIFPFGFLLFWSFYYTYYRPNGLFEKLSDRKDFDWSTLPMMVLGLLVWFIKNTLFEMVEMLLLSWIRPTVNKPTIQRPPGLVAIRVNTSQVPQYPREVRAALLILGIPNARSWNAVHNRYRELAKQLHPDLNSEITDAGQRFMQVDQAYHYLQSIRDQHFR